jgi:7-cyano-7-deazaguanine synthase in queuosine biosynthesis
MKIKVGTYRTRRIDKDDTRLTIPIEIEDTKGKVFNTAAVVQMTPITFFWGKSPSVAFSLLYLSAIAYAIDRSVDRHIHSIDGWSREFDVDIIIPDFQVFQLLEKQIDAMLSFLTGDYWSCHFVGSAAIRYGRYKNTQYFEGITQVNLFSGGMDSLIGAIDYMTDNPDGKLFLASHYDSNMSARPEQNKLKELFTQQFDKRFCFIPAVMVDPALSLENSCRSRSLMFISIALIVASYSNCNVIVPENGSVSLNYPLSASRRSSCSTRTTHPVFLKQLKEVIAALGFTSTVDNPYMKKTKGEMVRSCSDKDYLLKIVAFSNSCGKKSKRQFFNDNSEATHCGHCMPCMYRRAAMIGENDPTTYGNRFITLFNLKRHNIKNTLSHDFFAMLEFLKKDLTCDDIKKELRIAGMAGFEDIDEYVDLVVRTRAELASMIRADNNRTILSYMGW